VKNINKEVFDYEVISDGKGLFRLADRDGVTLFTRNKNTLYQDYYSRYMYSHYDLCITPPSKFINCNQHKDNLNNIPFSKKIVKDLKSIMPIKKGDVVVEAGAYQGFGTLKISQVVGGDGLVIAVEADMNNYEILCKNIEANCVKNVIPVCAAVWGSNLKMPFYSKGSQRRSLVKSVLKSDDSVLVQARTIDGILDDLDVKNVDFLTLEVNSAETEALRGFEKRLSSNHRMRIVSAGWYKDDDGGLGASSIVSELKNIPFLHSLELEKEYMLIGNRRYFCIKVHYV